MVVLIVVAVVVVLALVVGVILRLRVGTGSSIDLLQRVDPEAAARIEQQRAEQALRGMGQGGMGGFGGSH